MLTLIVFIFSIIAIFLLAAIVSYSLYLIINDFLTACVATPMRLYYDTYKSFTLLKCFFVLNLVRAFGYVSLSTLVLISVERYLKILDVQRYVKLINNKKIKITFICQWILAFVFSFGTDFEYEKYKHVNYNANIEFCFYDTILRNIHGIFLSMFVSIGVIITVIVIHVVLFIKVNDHFKLLEIEENARRNSNTAGVRNFEKKSSRLKVEVKIAVMTISIALAYCVFILPIVMIDLIRMFDQLVDPDYVIKTPQVAIDIAIALAAMYPTVESVLFLILNKPVWKQLKTTLTMGLPSIRTDMGAASNINH